MIRVDQSRVANVLDESLYGGYVPLPSPLLNSVRKPNPTWGMSDVARIEQAPAQPTSLRRVLQSLPAIGPQLTVGNARARTTAVQVIGFSTSIILVVLQPTHAGAGELPVWLGIAAGFVCLRFATVGRRLALSATASDAIAMAIFLAGTGAAQSPFVPLALTGAWWAAGLADQRGRVYGLVFLAAYLVFAGSLAMEQSNVADALYLPVTVLIVALLADRLHAMTRLAGRLASKGVTGVLTAQDQALLRGLSRAYPEREHRVDAVLTAGQLGLTATQTELLGYLMLGLTNQEISDAMGVSEATVRFRLTPLYRVLGVRGRKAAAAHARELGLDALVGPQSR